MGGTNSVKNTSDNTMNGGITLLNDLTEWLNNDSMEELDILEIIQDALFNKKIKQSEVVNILEYITENLIPEEDFVDFGL